MLVLMQLVVLKKRCAEAAALLAGWLVLELLVSCGALDLCWCHPHHHTALEDGDCGVDDPCCVLLQMQTLAAVPTESGLSSFVQHITNAVMIAVA